jgi:hypothetical protein
MERRETAKIVKERRQTFLPEVKFFFNMFPLLSRNISLPDGDVNKGDLNIPGILKISLKCV